jgi:hypothetical protein
MAMFRSRKSAEFLSHPRRRKQRRNLVTYLLQDPEVRAEYEALEWRGNRLVYKSWPKEPGLPERRKDETGATK